MLKKIIFGILGFITAITIGGFLFSKTYHIERSTDINAPVAAVFNNVNELKNFNKWSPWLEHDPSTQLSYGATTAGAGGSYSWKSKQMGDGTMTIIESTPNILVNYDLNFGGSVAKAGMKMAATDSLHTKITWSMDMDFGMNPYARLSGLFMDKFMAPDYEKGLANLKKLSETAN